MSTTNADPGMRWAMVVAVVGAIAMAVALVAGFATGGGWAEVRTLTGFVWFNVSIVDVYVGFALFAGWIVWREPPARAAALIVVLCLLGNLIACLYVILALRRSGGDWQRFWHGRRAESLGRTRQ